jgi:hypothetical protein
MATIGGEAASPLRDRCCLAKPTTGRRVIEQSIEWLMTFVMCVPWHRGHALGPSSCVKSIDLELNAHSPVISSPRFFSSRFDP